MNRREILESAIEIVCNDREKEYGSPEDNFGVISDLWSSYKGVSFIAQDVAIMLALLKIGRISSGQIKEDNYKDLAGYAACAGEIATENKKKGNIILTASGKEADLSWMYEPVCVKNKNKKLFKKT